MSHHPGHPSNGGPEAALVSGVGDVDASKSVNSVAAGNSEPSTSGSQTPKTKLETSQLDEGIVQISDDIFINTKKPLRKGMSIYEGYQEHVTGQKLPLAIKAIAPYSKKNIREVAILVNIASHPNVVRIIRSIEQQTPLPTLYIVMELCSPITLQDYLKEKREKKSPFDLKKAMSYSKGLIKGMQHIHGNRIIHGDIKPQNILFSLKGDQIKVADFEISQQLQQLCSATDMTSTGTHGYRAPETYDADAISLKADIFPLGITLYSLFTNGKHPFGEDSDLWMSNIKKNTGRDLSGLPEEIRHERDEFLNLLGKMLEFDPKKRPTIEEISEHPFFSSSQASTEVSSTGHQSLGTSPEDSFPERPFVVSTTPENLFASDETQPKEGREMVVRRHDRDLSPQQDPWVSAEDPIPEIQHYIEKLESSVSKEERLMLFHEISEHEPWQRQRRDITKTIRNIDFSGVALQSQDVSAIGSIMNFSTHLDSVNLKACKLLPGSLQILRNMVNEIGKVAKFRVDSNPDLTVDDLIAGVDLCARVGARYVYDLDHLSASDRQKFTSHSRKYQPKDESAEKKMSKTRKSLIREQRFQRMYKKPSSNERERIRHVLDFSSKFEEQPEPAERSKEDPEAKMTPATSPGEEKVGSLQLDVEPAEGSKEDQEEKQTSGNSRGAEAVGSPQFDTEPPGGESSSGIARKIRPRTLNEFVKLKPVEKFNKMIASSGEDMLEAGGRAMLGRRLKTMAMNSDRRRFESASLNKFGSKLRPYMRNTQLEVSTGIVKSSKDDSGYKTRSSFSETSSCKSNLRRYSRRSDQDTERKSSIESTQAASLERIEEVDIAAENSGSSDSGISPKNGTHRQKHDPKRLIEQRFEMTVLGLGALQNRREQLQLWMENAQFDVLSTDLGAIAGQIPDCKLEQLEFRYSPLSTDKEIGPEGGNLFLDESSLAIPPNSLVDTQNLYITMMMAFQFLSLPPNRIPVSPYFDIKFHGKLRIPAKARIPTWFRPSENSEHGIKIYKRYRDDENKFVWRELQNEVIVDDEMLEFEIDHFCGFLAMFKLDSIKEQIWGKGEIKLTHGLFHFGENFRSAICYRKPKSLFQQMVAYFEKNGYNEIYSNRFVMKSTREFPVRMECFDPHLHEFDPQQFLLTPNDVIANDGIQFPFLLRHLDGPKDAVDIKYIVDDFTAPMKVTLLEPRGTRSDDNIAGHMPAANQMGIRGETNMPSSKNIAATSAAGLNHGDGGTVNVKDTIIDIHADAKEIGAGSRSIAAGRDVFNVHGGALVLCVLVLFILCLCSVMFAFLLVYFWFGLSPRFLQIFSTDHDEI